MKLINQQLIEISDKNMRSGIFEPIYDPDQLNALLEKFPKRLQEWLDRGLIKFSAIRGKFYYQHSDVVAMLNFFKINN